MSEAISLPEPRDDADRKVLVDVTSVGWHVVHVMPDGATLGWSFTIGLHRSFAHPEVVVFGLEHDVAHSVLNDIGDSAREGTVREAGSLYDDLLEGLSCAFRPVRDVWYPPFLGYATWFYGEATFPTLQLVWPDREGRFPWQVEFDRGLVSTQPLLFESDPGRARAEALLRSLGGGA